MPGTSEEVDLLALDRQVCFALAVASRSVIALYRPLLDPMGLTHPQYLVMLALWEESPLSVKQLSNLLQLDPGTLSPLLKRLESSGFITRVKPDGTLLPKVETPPGSITQVRFGGSDMRDCYINAVPADGGDSLKEGRPLSGASYLYRGRSEVPGMPIEPARFRLG